MPRILFLAFLIAVPAGFSQNANTLRLADAITARFEDGPALGSLRPVPGEVVYFSFFVENYTRSETRKVELTGHVQILDPRGIPISPTEDIPLVTTLSEEDKTWRPKMRTAIAIPPIAPPGTYKVKYDVTDEQSHQTASAETSFNVDAKYVAPSTVLAVRELNFFHNQDDTTPLITPLYRPGDMVWVKCYIDGYKIGEQNSIDVSYDVELLQPDGTSFMKKEDAAMEKSTSYYPQPYIPAIFNLTLKPTTSQNVYTVVITAHDNIGNQIATAKSKFQVN
jgi:hypothetical protein